MKIQTIKILENQDTTGIPSKVICSNCAHVSENVEVKTVDIYFPNRRLRDGDGKAIVCEGCKEDNDLTIFGEQHCSSIRNIELIIHPNIKENNRIYNAAEMVNMLRLGVRHKSKQMILRAYALAEMESFTWDGLDEVFAEWDALVSDANDIAYEEK